ncbi:hypothetical protein [Kitasatospora sp. LaBMicrA B282]|uniref:hypothetical protein n=1 Tax=Kitasatospora sp. LaBMicrA B282 TaxID=3420949 RepID=UPI003D0B1109
MAGQPPEASPRERPEPQRRRAPGLRSSLAGLLIVLAALLTPLGILSVWVVSQITDTDRYLATVAPLAHNADVQAGVTQLVSDRIAQQIELGSLIDGLAPGLGNLLGPLTGVLDNGVAGVVRSQVAQLVDGPAFADLWLDVNRTAHASLVQGLTGHGGGGAVRISGDTVTLDLAPLMDQVKNALAAHGLPIATKLPATHTDYTLVSSPAVHRVRTGFRLLQEAGYWLPAGAAVLATAGVLLARRRRRAVVGAALGCAGGAVLLGITVTVFRGSYLDALPDAVSPPAAGAVYDALTRFLTGGVRDVVLLGVLVALGAWLTGPGQWARPVRRHWQAGLATLRWDSGRPGGLRHFVHRHKALLGWGALLLAAAGLLAAGYPTVLAMLGVVGGLLLVLALLEVLDEPPPGQPPPPETDPTR